MLKKASYGIITGNYFAKYSSEKVIYKYMVDKFVACAQSMLKASAPRRILEVGCGPGDLALRLVGPQAGMRDGDATELLEYTGTDLSETEVIAARERCPGRSFQTASVYNLPFDDLAFDLVIACEVFEHLERPVAALMEVKRVCRNHLLLSVPWEPVWRIANMCRLQYLKSLGNTPGHIQHFSRTGIRRLVASRFQILQECRPFPWTMLLARRNTAET